MNTDRLGEPLPPCGDRPSQDARCRIRVRCLPMAALAAADGAWNTPTVKVLNSNPVLAVHDLKQSAAWYRDVLGCEVRDPEPGNWTFCRCGDIDFMLGRCPDAMPASELGDHSYVAYLRVDDARERAPACSIEARVAHPCVRRIRVGRRLT